MPALDALSEPQLPSLKREFVLTDGTILQTRIMPVGVDFVHLSTSLAEVPDALRDFCSPTKRPYKSSWRSHGFKQRDGFNVSLSGPIGQLNPKGMFLSLSFNPNTLDHHAPQTGEICVRGDNTLAYSPPLLNVALQRANAHLKSLGVTQDAFTFDVTGVDLTRDMLFDHPRPSVQFSQANEVVGSILELLSWSIPPYLRNRADYANKTINSEDDDALEGLDRHNKSRGWTLYNKTLERQQKEARAKREGFGHGPVDFVSDCSCQLRLEWKLRNRNADRLVSRAATRISAPDSSLTAHAFSGTKRRSALRQTSGCNDARRVVGRSGFASCL